MSTATKYVLAGFSFVSGVCNAGIGFAVYQHSGIAIPIVIAAVIFGCCTLATLADMEHEIL